MKVISKGKEGGLWTPEITCTGYGNGSNGCGAVLEINADDVFHTSRTDYGGDTDHYFTIECPECECWTDLDTKKTKMPYGVISSVLKMKSRTQSS